MTEPADGPQASDNSPPPEGEPGDVLDTFKARAEEADNENVHDAIGGRPRLNWSPVTDGGGRASTESQDERSSFHFDLGGALARLGEQPTKPVAEGHQDKPVPPPPPPPPPPGVQPSPSPEVEQGLPQRAPNAARPADPVAAPAAEHAVPARPPVAPEAAPAPLEPLPRRGERPAAEAPVAAGPVAPREPSAGPYVTARRSVFDDVAAAPGTALSPSVRPPAAPIVPPPATPAGAGPAAPTPPHPPAGAVLPTLPAPAAHATPMYTPPIESAPSTPDVNAFRSAQLRGSRQKRQGKMFSRTMLALLVVAGLVAAAFVFGRRYLFPTQWDQSLTPIVDDIQNERGVEFDHTVGLVTQPPADYALTIGRLVVDDGWLAQVPAWRALGLTTGEPTVDGIAPALGAARLAVYDPDADRIYVSAEAAPDAAAADLRLALEQAYAAQHGNAESAAPDESNSGFLGVSPPQHIVDTAIATYLAERATPAATSSEISGTTATPEAASVAALPLPIEYELAAIDDLGEALLSAAGVDPTTVRAGMPYPDNAGAALDDGARPTASGALQVGDRSLAPPIALGVDDWSLVWGSRLAQSTVDQLTSIVVADSFRPIDRAGLTCALAVFETADATGAATVLAAMQTWAAAAPADAQTTVTQLADTRVQLSACDPGADAATVPQPGAVDAVINRQLTRLAG